MNVKVMTEMELVLLRGWMIEIYNNGHGFVTATKDQLAGLYKKLEQLDAELLLRVLEEKIVASFVDENFEKTLEDIRAGKTEPKKEE